MLQSIKTNSGGKLVDNNEESEWAKSWSGINVSQNVVAFCGLKTLKHIDGFEISSSRCIFLNFRLC